MDSINDDETSPNQTQFPPMAHYYSFFIGQLISILGSEIVRFSLIWWIAVESQSAWYLSLAAFLVYGVKALVSSIAGVFADRWNRKRIIFFTDLLQALTSFLMIWLFLLQQAELWNILLLMGVSSAFAAFQDPTVNAIIPVMVPQKNLSKLNSFRYFTSYMMRMFGPLIGALLLSQWTITQILWLDFASFILAITPLIFISIPHAVKIKSFESSENGEINEIAESTDGPLRKFWAEFKEGLSTIKIAGILGITLLFPFTNLFETPKNVLFPLLISDTYQGGPLILAGIILVAQLTTALTSFVLSIKGIPDRIPRQKIAVFGLIGIFLGSIIMIIPSEIAPGSQLGWKVVFLVIGIMFMGFFSPIINITMTTVVQKLVPPDKLGRVDGVGSALSLSLMPLGTLFTGFIAEIIGIRTIILFSAIIAIVGITIFYYTTDLSNIDAKLANTAVAFPNQQ